MNDAKVEFEKQTGSLLIKNTHNEEVITEKLARISSLEEEVAKCQQEYVRSLFKILIWKLFLNIFYLSILKKQLNEAKSELVNQIESMTVKNTRSEEIIAEKIAKISSLEEEIVKFKEEYVRNSEKYTVVCTFTVTILWL